MRLSRSFSESEVLWGERLLITLQRGGDVSGLMRDPESESMLRCFVRMKQRIAVPGRLQSRRLDDVTVATCAGLRGILGMREMGRIVGMSPSGLNDAVKRWRWRMEQELRDQLADEAMAAE